MKKFFEPADKQAKSDAEVGWTLATVATATLAVHQLHHEPRTPAAARETRSSTLKKEYNNKLPQ